MFGNNDYKALQSKYMAAVNTLNTVNRTVSVMEKEIEDYKNTIETLDTKMKSVDISHSVEVESLKLKLKETENSVNFKVNSALASIGVTKFAAEVISSPPTTTPQETLNTFMSLTGEDKSNYYKDNKEQIALALKSQKINKG